jgi:hypothetical protein
MKKDELGWTYSTHVRSHDKFVGLKNLDQDK